MIGRCLLSFALYDQDLKGFAFVVQMRDRPDKTSAFPCCAFGLYVMMKSKRDRKCEQQAFHRLNTRAI